MKQPISFIFAGLLAGLTSLALAGDPLIDATIAANQGNADKALKILMPMAEQGDPDAMLRIGKLYWDGNGIDRDGEKALYWFNEAALIWNKQAHENDPRAWTSLGIMLKDGLGYKKDLSKAQQFFSRAFDIAQPLALNGDLESQYLLGAFFMNGRGVSRDAYAGEDWLSKAGEGGHKTAAYMLVHIYECGCRGLPKNDEKAEYWRGKLAN